MGKREEEQGYPQPGNDFRRRFADDSNCIDDCLYEEAYEETYEETLAFLKAGKRVGARRLQ